MNEATKGVGEHQGLIAKIVRVADAIAVLGGYAAMACLAALTLLMLAQISVAALSRIFTFMRGDISVAWEYGSYLMGATFMLGSGLTLRAGRHIRLGVLVNAASGFWTTVLETFSSAIGLCFAAFLTYSLGSATLVSFKLGTASISSGTQLWIPYAAFAVGTGILALQFAVRLLTTLSGHPVQRPSLNATHGEFE